MADAVESSAVHALRPRLQDMANAAALVDSKGVIQEASPSLSALLGWTERELVGRELQDLRVADRTGADGPSWRVCPSSTVGDLAQTPVHRYRHRAGHTLWVEIVSIPLSAIGSECGGSLHILQDVSARFRCAKGLMASVAFVASQTTEDGVDLKAFLDFGCRCFDLDIGAFLRTDGGDWQLAAICGDDDGSFVAEFDRLSTVNRRDDGRDTDGIGGLPTAGDPIGAFRILLTCAVSLADRSFGTLVFAGRGAPAQVFDDRDNEILSFIARCLAMQLQADDAKRQCENVHRQLRRSEERYRQLYEETPAMLHSIDDRGRLASVSDAWLKVLGYAREEVLGRPSTDFLTPESKRYAEEVALPAYRANGFCNDVAYQFVTKDGELRDILLSAISQTDDDGRFQRSLAVLLDVTERRRIEANLARKTEALRRSTASIARFAQIASHDLQEPLRRLVTYCDVLKEDYGAELSEGAAAMASIIQSGGRRLRLMIGGLLAYIRVGEYVDHDAEPVDMAVILSHALGDLDEDILSREVHVEVGRMPTVSGSSTLFKMLVHHLLANALEHGGDGATTIDVSAEDGGDVWRFAVADDGIGVEPRFADRIFEIFQRLHLDDDRQGSGAGLAICRLIVERCGGEIWLDHDHRSGARFLFTLPKAEPEPSGPAKQSPSMRSKAIDLAQN